MSAIDIQRVRSETPGVGRAIHLNNAGASLMPGPVVRAMQEYLAFESVTGGYEAAAARADQLEDFYAVCGRLIGADARNIGFMASATDAFGRALSSVPLSSGDIILTSRNDYISNQIAFLSFAKRFGVRIERAEDLPEGGVDPDSIRSCIDRHRPKLVSISHVPTNSGLIQDVATIGGICRENEVLYLVDACQSVGQMPVDVGEIGCDFLSVTFRKFLRGPRGAGFLYVSDRALQMGLEPLLIDMRGARWTGADRYTPDTTARRFEEWEQSYVLMTGARAACQYALDIGLERIQDRIFQMAQALRRKLAELPGVQVLDRGADKCAITTSYFESSSPGELKNALHGINVGFSLAEYAVIDFAEKQVPWAMRASPHYYNTDEELAWFLDRLESLPGPDR